MLLVWLEETCIQAQSFLLQSLKRLSGLMEAQDMDRRAGLIWLLDCFANVSDADLDDFASYGQGIGPEKASSEHLTGDTQSVHLEELF